jgi:phosphate transport system substrate-binding protein
MKTLKPCLLFVAACAMFPSLTEAQAKVDAKIPHYEPVKGIAGSLNAMGSGTLTYLMNKWGEGYKAHYGGVKFQVEGKGSNSAPPALIEGTAQLGPMSRQIDAKEIDQFEKKFGYKPTEVRVAVDALAVFVHKDNPLTSLTLPQVDAVFGKNRSLKFKEDVTTWGQLGLTGDWAKKPIRLYGRDTASGTYKYFQEHALGKGDFKDSVNTSPGPEGVVSLVGSNPEGIGYSGVGNTSSDVKLISIAKEEGQAPVSPADQEAVYAGKYPMARYLYIYVNKAPGKTLEPIVSEFLRYVLSAEGQEIVVAGQFLPMKAKTVAAEYEKLGIPMPKGSDKPAADASEKKSQKEEKKR